ncbi:Phage integrase [Laribacter hongkongensis HLHK9]|uniref:Phage integrase n=1 Tax=Laribacter hongkongensis (strain HLHK9) TaxID=557598 RepID=C1D584_LARHH|nr:site-specific integrase [Laribacter hongkongensis]ACO73901.1 Phage integrase [Laribacter hongkongensis HLHK9]
MGRSAIVDYTGIRPVSESSIEIAFTFAGERCRERIKLKPTPANLKRAAQHRAAILAAIENGTFVYAVTFPHSKKAVLAKRTPVAKYGKTLDAWMSEWLKRCERYLKSSTLHDYKTIAWRQLSPVFGNHQIGDIKRSDIRAWCDGLTCSNKRIANILSVFRASLTAAMDDELIDTNPLSGWTYRRREEVKEDDIDPFTPDEQTAILEALPEAGCNMIRFAFWTGLRTSELVALEWKDIDWVGGKVSISKALTQRATKAETPKTRASRRFVTLLQPALEALMAQKAVTFFSEHGRVWIDPRTGEPWTGDQAIRKTLWTPALRRAGVRYRRPYQTRHTFASMMLSAGESPVWVANQMGHASWTMIARVYGRWIPNGDNGDGQKAVKAFSGQDADKKSWHEVLKIASFLPVFRKTKQLSV